MDKLEGFKNITLDEAIREIKKLRQSLVGAVQNAECREEKLEQEIERLKKEKEWLLNDNAQSEYWSSGRTTIEKCRERIIKRMKQVLKE